MKNINVKKWEKQEIPSKKIKYYRFDFLINIFLAFLKLFRKRLDNRKIFFYDF